MATDDIEAAVQAAMQMHKTGCDIAQQHDRATSYGVCGGCESHRAAVEAAIRHVADVARQDALRDMPCQTEIGEPAKGPCASRTTVTVYNFAEKKPREVPFLREMWCQRCDLLAEAEEAVRRDA